MRYLSSGETGLLTIASVPDRHMRDNRLRVETPRRCSKMARRTTGRALRFRQRAHHGSSGPGQGVRGYDTSRPSRRRVATRRTGCAWCPIERPAGGSARGDTRKRGGHGPRTRPG
jgi:hypothetical protein